MQAKLPVNDIVFLRLENPLTAEEVPDRDNEVYRGCPYILCGRSSNRGHDPPLFAISLGSISKTMIDARGFIRGDTATTRIGDSTGESTASLRGGTADTASAIGDSGGGCFSMVTGCLIAMNVGNDEHNSNRSILMPVGHLDGFRGTLPPEKPLASWPVFG